MKSVLHRPLAWVTAVLLLPACWAAVVAFCLSLPTAFRVGASGGLYPLSTEGWVFILGVGVYAVWHRLRPPEFLYTFVHEFTHLAFGLLTGKRVDSFEVRRGSGKVGLSGTNPVVTLAPYFFPLPTVVVLAVGGLAGWGLGYAQIGWATAFLAGLTLCLHVLMTLRALATPQPDLARGGRVFSWVFIFFWGMVFVGGAILVAAGGWGMTASFGKAVWRESLGAYGFLFEHLKRIAGPA